MSDWLRLQMPEIVTGITLMIGVLLSFAAGLELRARELWHWPPAERTVLALTAASLGGIFLHIAVARMAGYQVSLLDLNSAWTAGIRLIALVLVAWSVSILHRRSD